MTNKKLTFGFQNEAVARETSPQLWWAITELARQTGTDPDAIWESGYVDGFDEKETLQRLLELALDPEEEDETLIWGSAGVVARAVKRNDGRLELVSV